MLLIGEKNINPTLKCILISVILTSVILVKHGCVSRENNISLRHLVKRQASSTNQANSGATVESGSAGDKLLSSSVDAAGNQLDADGKVIEETLTNLKCSFGSAEAADLCKFHLNENPLSRDLAGWAHGSGRLALYQGGPLMDASGGNDTSGGYIFYETSSLHAATQMNMTANSRINAHQNQQQHHTSANSISNINHKRPSSINLLQYNSNTNSLNNNNREIEEYRRVSSSQYSIMNHANNNNNNNHHGPTSSTGDINGPVFISPNLTSTSVAGMCLSFQYAIKGLSADELRVSVNDLKTGKSRPIWQASESSAGNWTKAEVLYSASNKHAVQFAAIHHSSAHQISGPVSSSQSIGSSANGQGNNHEHANLQWQHQKFRGYVAVDEIEIDKHDASGSDSAACRGHCNFDGDLCGWTNTENGPEGDDFDWSFGRGSDNLFTGPARDFVSSMNNELTGSYLQIDPSYPRRPGDKATLLSPLFQPTTTNEPMCMRLAVHMFGSGIGSLAIKIRYTDEAPISSRASSNNTNSQSTPTSSSGQQQANNANGSGNSGGGGGGGGGGDKIGANDLVIWEMFADSGNVWHQAQTSVSSSKSPFYVVIEGTIGDNHLSNIAIDEISFAQGACPSSPPVASKNYGDCTFEQSMCYWRNPNAEIHLDDLDWIRMAEEQTIHGPNSDHTTKKRSGSYLKLENTMREPKSGMRAFLLSPIFQPRASVQCLSFYYYMFMRSISSSGPNLGTIRVYLASNNELTPVWRLTNPISSPIWKHARVSLSSMMLDGLPVAPTKLFQIAFEGIWGDAASGAIALDDVTVFDGACDLLPMEARAVAGECTFDVDLCSWVNKTVPISAGAASSSALQYDQLTPADSPNSSPFIQYINGVGPSSSGSGGSSAKPAQMLMPQGWQLATVNSRPINLQDHTYKAPIGYVYLDILDPAQGRFPYILQSNEIVLQQGQQIAQCLSFWFVAFGRNEPNQLQVFLTQASQPPPQSESETTSGQKAAPNQPNSQDPTIVAAIQPNNANNQPDSDNAQAWKSFDGKLLWSVALKNMTESTRRRWDYAQVAIKADSNYIVRFIALSSDGGFALDDISYYEGACETRPAIARVQMDDSDSSSTSAGGSNSSASPNQANNPNSDSNKFNGAA